MKRRPNDKILDNKYNSGSLEYEIFNARDFRVNTEFAESNMQSELDNEKYNRHAKILSEIEGIVKESKFNVSGNTKKKIPKSQLSSAFIYIHEHLKSDNYTNVEIIIGICEYLGCNYTAMYSELPVPFKEKILNELNEDYHIIKDNNKHKLF